MKRYFQKDNMFSYSLSWHKEYMRENEIKTMSVFKAKIEYGESYFYCSKLDKFGEVGEGCGTICEEYLPRNGKNGRCRFSKNCYAPGDELIIKLK